MQLLLGTVHLLGVQHEPMSQWEVLRILFSRHNIAVGIEIFWKCLVALWPVWVLAAVVLALRAFVERKTPPRRRRRRPR